jgi:uncharacterized protein YndB with AHSA1/START domain
MTTQTAPAPLALRLDVRHTFDAPVERVFCAWTDFDKFTRWLGGGCSKFKSTKADVRVGGHYKIEGTGCESGGETIVTGTYREIVPHSRLVFTWAHQTPPANADGDTLVTVTFKAVGSKTEVHLVHEGFASEKSRNGHNDGWTRSMTALAEILTK